MNQLNILKPWFPSMKYCVPAARPFVNRGCYSTSRIHDSTDSEDEPTRRSWFTNILKVLKPSRIYPSVKRDYLNFNHEKVPKPFYDSLLTKYIESQKDLKSMEALTLKVLWLLRVRREIERIDDVFYRQILISKGTSHPFEYEEDKLKKINDLNMRRREKRRQRFKQFLKNPPEDIIVKRLLENIGEMSIEQVAEDAASTYYELSEFIHRYGNRALTSDDFRVLDKTHDSDFVMILLKDFEKAPYALKYGDIKIPLHL